MRSRNGIKLDMTLLHGMGRISSLNCSRGQLLSDCGTRCRNNFTENLANPLRSSFYVHSVDILYIISIVRQASCLKHLREMRLGLSKLELLPLLLIVLYGQLFVLSHEFAIHSVHGFGPDAWLTLLLLHVAVVLINLGLRCRLLLLLALPSILHVFVLNGLIS
jgi:hypothetical protein